jgi:hypothetical protein
MSISADAIIALSLELKSRLLQALTCWQVEEYERSATAESRREARIAAVRAIILGGMITEWGDMFTETQRDPHGWVNTRLKNRQPKMLDLAGAD